MPIVGDLASIRTWNYVVAIWGWISYEVTYGQIKLYALLYDTWCLSMYFELDIYNGINIVANTFGQIFMHWDLRKYCHWYTNLYKKVCSGQSHYTATRKMNEEVPYVLPSFLPS